MNLDLAHNYKTFQNIHLQWSSTFMVCISDNYADLLKVLSMEISDNIEQILTIVKRKNEKKNVWKFEERLIKTTKQKIIKWKFRQEVVSLKTLLLKRLGNAEVKHAWNQSNWKMPFRSCWLADWQQKLNVDECWTKIINLCLPVMHISKIWTLL